MLASLIRIDVRVAEVVRLQSSLRKPNSHESGYCLLEVADAR